MKDNDSSMCASMKINYIYKDVFIQKKYFFDVTLEIIEKKQHVFLHYFY